MTLLKITLAESNTVQKQVLICQVASYCKHNGYETWYIQEPCCLAVDDDLSDPCQVCLYKRADKQLVMFFVATEMLDGTSCSFEVPVESCVVVDAFPTP